MPRGTPISAEDYLTHLALAYAASPAETPEESVAKALLELACARLGVSPQEFVTRVMSSVGGGRLLPPWETGTGAPAEAPPPPPERVPLEWVPCSYCPGVSVSGRCRNEWCESHHRLPRAGIGPYR